MLALINTSDCDEVLNHLETMVFDMLPEPQAEDVWDNLSGLATGGASAEFLYDELYRYIEEGVND